MKIYNDIVYGGRNKNDDNLKLDMYIPNKSGYDTIVYFHGGGLSGGTKSDWRYAEIAKSFADNGFGLVSVEYSKYPDAKFPVYIEDCAEAVSFVKNKIKNYGGSGDIIISGQSAGAWISLMLCFNRTYLEKVAVNPDEIKGYLIDSAQTTSHFNVLKIEEGLNPLAQRIDKYAPLYYVDENTRFSRMLLIVYEKDMPCRPEQNMLLFKNILAYNPDADIKLVKLSGEHCAGSTIKDDSGEFPFVKVALKWLAKSEK